MTGSRVTDGNPSRKSSIEFAGFQVVKQRLHGNSRPVKHDGATHHVRAARDDRLLHSVDYTPTTRNAPNALPYARASRLAATPIGSIT